MFQDGIHALKGVLPQYDLGFWIKYNLCNQHFYPKPDQATIVYFRIINAQLHLLYRMTGEAYFQEYAAKWKEYDRPFNIIRMYWLKYKALRKLNRL